MLLNQRNGARLACSVAVAVWLASSPYAGIQHDAVLYAAEAIRRLPASGLQNDSFFRYGSQGDFSVYVALYAMLVQKLGVGAAALISAGLGRLAWLMGVVLICFVVVPARLRWMAISLVLILPTYYEPFRIFSYDEPFATPRVWSEAAVLVAIYLACFGRWYLAAAMLLMACAIHPLMAAPAVFLLLVWRIGESAFKLGVGANKKALMLGVPILSATLLTVCLCVPGIAPFDRLLQRYDDAWWQIVLSRNGMVVMQAWDAADFCRPGGYLLLLALVWLRAGAASQVRRITSATAVAAIFFLAVWGIGSALHNVLLVQLQLWRICWVVQMLVPILWVSTLLREPQPRNAAVERAEMIMVLAALVSSTWNSVPLAALALALHAGGHRLSELHARRATQLAWACLLIVALSQLMGLRDLVTASSLMERSPFPWLTALARAPALWVLAGLVAIAACRPHELPRRFAAVAVAAGACLATLAAGFWCAAAVAQTRADDTPAWITALRSRVPAGATVYWDRPLTSTWLQLQRAHYASNMQGASALFSRPGALELQRRLWRLQELQLTSGPAVWAGGSGAGVLTGERAVHLCQDAALDYVLVDGRWPGAQSIGAGDGGQPLSVFQCDLVRPLAAGGNS